MTREELQAMTASYSAKGGQVKQCALGDNAIRAIPTGLWRCECGCHGNYTDHSMRAGESGRCASVIIR